MGNKAVMARGKSQPVDWEALIDGISGGKTAMECGANRNIVLRDWPPSRIFDNFHRRHPAISGLIDGMSNFEHPCVQY